MQSDFYRNLFKIMANSVVSMGFHSESRRLSYSERGTKQTIETAFSATRFWFQELDSGLMEWQTIILAGLFNSCHLEKVRGSIKARWQLQLQRQTSRDHIFNHLIHIWIHVHLSSIYTLWAKLNNSFLNVATEFSIIFLVSYIA